MDLLTASLPLYAVSLLSLTKKKKNQLFLNNLTLFQKEIVYLKWTQNAQHSF